MSAHACFKKRGKSKIKIKINLVFKRMKLKEMGESQRGIRVLRG
jgi:hypothetical protein